MIALLAVYTSPISVQWCLYNRDTVHQICLHQQKSKSVSTNTVHIKGQKISQMVCIVFYVCVWVYGQTQTSSYTQIHYKYMMTFKMMSCEFLSSLFSTEHRWEAYKLFLFTIITQPTLWKHLPILVYCRVQCSAKIIQIAFFLTFCHITTTHFH